MILRNSQRARGWGSEQIEVRSSVIVRSKPSHNAIVAAGHLLLQLSLSMKTLASL